MHLVQFLLPLRDNKRRPFHRAVFERVRTELTERSGGVTALLQSPAVGMTEALDRPWWKGYRAELERRFHQETLAARPGKGSGAGLPLRRARE